MSAWVRQTDVVLKLELFQHTGSFKPRGALTVVNSLDAEALRRGLTAVSAGNHAIAVAYAAARRGTHAKVVMLGSANAARIARCRQLGAEVILSTTGATAFALADQLRVEEGRTFVHPFEGPLTALGTATLGAGVCRAGGVARCIDHPGRRRRALRRRRLGVQGLAAALPHLRRRAPGCGYDAPELRGRIPAKT